MYFHIDALTAEAAMIPNVLPLFPPLAGHLADHDANFINTEVAAFLTSSYT